MPTTLKSAEKDSGKSLIVAGHKDGIALTVVFSNGRTSTVIVEVVDLDDALRVEADAHREAATAAGRHEERIVAFAELLQNADGVTHLPGHPHAKYRKAAEAAIAELAPSFAMSA